MRLLRLNSAGEVVGLPGGDRATAEKNLAEGEFLRPWPRTIDPWAHRFDLVSRRWRRKPPAPRPEDDYRLCRRNSFPTEGEQLGAIVKLLSAILAGDPVAAADRAEFDALAARISAAKAQHPKRED